MSLRPLIAKGLFFMEVWKDVKGYEGLYQVSSYGRIRRNFKKGYKIKKNVVNFNGYLQTTFSKKGKFKTIEIHRLVALSFITNNEKKPCVNHKNGIKTDNKVENLEWCTYSENELHSYIFLEKKTNGIINRKIPLNKIDYIKNLNKNGISQAKIAEIFNVSQSCISRLINSKTYVKHLQS